MKVISPTYLAILAECQLVTDRQSDIQTHDATMYHASIPCMIEMIDALTEKLCEIEVLQHIFV